MDHNVSLLHINFTTAFCIGGPRVLQIQFLSNKIICLGQKMIKVVKMAIMPIKTVDLAMTKFCLNWLTFPHSAHEKWTGKYVGMARANKVVAPAVRLAFLQHCHHQTCLAGQKSANKGGSTSSETCTFATLPPPHMVTDWPGQHQQGAVCNVLSLYNKKFGIVGRHSPYFLGCHQGFKRGTDLILLNNSCGGLDRGHDDAH